MSSNKNFIVSTKGVLKALNTLLTLSEHCDFMRNAVLRAIPEFDPTKARFRKVNGNLVVGLWSFNYLNIAKTPDNHVLLDNIETAILSVYQKRTPGPIYKEPWFAWLTILTNCIAYLKYNHPGEILLNENFFPGDDADDTEDSDRLDVGYVVFAFVYVVGKAFEDLNAYVGLSDTHEDSLTIWENLPKETDPAFSGLLDSIAILMGCGADCLTLPFMYIKLQYTRRASSSHINTAVASALGVLSTPSSFASDVFPWKDALAAIKSWNISGVTVEQSMYVGRAIAYLSSIPFYLKTDDAEVLDRDLRFGFAFAHFVQEILVTYHTTRGAALLFVLCELISTTDTYFNRAPSIRRPDIDVSDIAFGHIIK